MTCAMLFFVMLRCPVHGLCSAALCYAVLSSGGMCRQTSESGRAGSAGPCSRKRDAPGPNLAIDQQELQGNSSYTLATKQYGIGVTDNHIMRKAIVVSLI